MQKYIIDGFPNQGKLPAVNRNPFKGYSNNTAELILISDLLWCANYPGP